MKRVLHVLSSLERSGMEMMLLSSAAEWTQFGFSCDVLASAPIVGPLEPQMRAAGYAVHHLPFRSNFRYLPRLDFIAGFYRLCRSGYDVVHIHTEAAVPVLAILAKLAGVRRIAVTPHNTFYFDGILRVRKILERFLVRMLGGRYGMISEGVQECEWKTFRNRGIRIWNWLDTSRFRPPTWEERNAARLVLGCKEDQFVVVSVGNCNEVKNHSELLRAISLMRPQFRSLYFHVGRESVDFPERELASELGILEKVRFAGSSDDVRQFLWAADVFAMPSLREGLPLAAIEAISSGLPAVLANIAGLRDVAGETSFTVLTSTSAESIAAGLEQMAELSPEERSQRGRIDSERIRRRFSIHNGVQSIVDGLYGEDAAQAGLRSAGVCP